MNFRAFSSSRFTFPGGAFHHAGQRRSLFSFFCGPKSNVPALYQAGKEPWLRPTMVLLGVMPIFTFALGTWQLKRLKWKINLIDELEEKLQLAPLNLPPKINLSVIPDFVFRRVRVKGRWDYDHTMLLSPRVREGVHGAHVVTPFVRENGTTILVDRGFVSKEKLPLLDAQRDEGLIELVAMIRASQPRNRFTPDNEPEKGSWHWTDVDAMAEFAGGAVKGVQPVFVEQVFDGHAGEAESRISKGVPVGRPPTVNLRNSHLSYVITWYSLSALTGFMFYRVLLNKRNSPGKRMPRFK